MWYNKERSQINYHCQKLNFEKREAGLFKILSNSLKSNKTVKADDVMRGEACDE